MHAVPVVQRRSLELPCGGVHVAPAVRAGAHRPDLPPSLNWQKKPVLQGPSVSSPHGAPAPAARRAGMHFAATSPRPWSMAHPHRSSPQPPTRPTIHGSHASPAFPDGPQRPQLASTSRAHCPLTHCTPLMHAAPSTRAPGTNSHAAGRSASHATTSIAVAQALTAAASTRVPRAVSAKAHALDSCATWTSSNGKTLGMPHRRSRVDDAARSARHAVSSIDDAAGPVVSPPGLDDVPHAPTASVAATSRGRTTMRRTWIVAKCMVRPTQQLPRRVGFGDNPRCCRSSRAIDQGRCERGTTARQ